MVRVMFLAKNGPQRLRRSGGTDGEEGGGKTSKKKVAASSGGARADAAGQPARRRRYDSPATIASYGLERFVGYGSKRI